MLIAFITDIHNGPRAYHDGLLRKLSDDAVALTEEFVGAMNRIVRPDLVINLGDVVEDETPEADERHYHQIAQVLRELDCDVLHLTGNHDEVNLSPEQLRALRGPWSAQAPLRAGGFEVLTLATHSDLERTWVEDADVARLEAELGAGEGPAIVCMHHPISEQDLRGNPWFERAPHLALVEGRERVRRVIEASGRVRAVFNGHVHWNHHVVHGGVPYFTIQSLIENVAAPDAAPQPAAAWATAEFGERGVRVEVRGWDSAEWEYPAP
jgi:Icc protein